MKTLSLDRPLVFVHIPKTAGTSFANYLIGHLDPDQVAPPFMGDINTMGIGDPRFVLFWGHFRYSRIHPLLPQADYLTFLRDPIDRAHSQYKSWNNPANFAQGSNWRKATPEDKLADIDFAQRATFEEFVMSDRPRVRRQISNVHTLMLSREEPESGAFLESAKDTVRSMAFVGLVEDFEASIAKLRQAVPGLLPYALGVEKENRSRPGVLELSAEGRGRLEELNVLDRKLYAFVQQS